MKKTYINPCIEVYKIETPNLCIVSGGETTGSADFYTEGEKVNSGDALSREGRGFFDE